MFSGDNNEIMTELTSTKGLSFLSSSKMFGGMVSRRACRRAAFSADIRVGWGSWVETGTWYHTAAGFLNKTSHNAENWVLRSSCALEWEWYLQELTGGLTKVADDAFQSLSLILVGYCIQIHCTCREEETRKSEILRDTRRRRRNNFST